MECRYEREIRSACKELNKCIKLVKKYNRLINDHRGSSRKEKYVTKDEIREVVGLPPQGDTTPYRAVKENGIITVTQLSNGHRYQKTVENVNQALYQKGLIKNISQIQERPTDMNVNPVSGQQPASPRFGSSFSLVNATANMAKVMKNVVSVVASLSTIIIALAALSARGEVDASATTIRQMNGHIREFGSWLRRTVGGIRPRR